MRANENFLSLARKLEVDTVKEMTVFQVLINTKLYLSRNKEKNTEKELQLHSESLYVYVIYFY